MLVFVIAVAVVLSAAFRLLLEVPQMFVLKHRYLLEVSNWMQIVLFLSSIVFAWVFNTPCYCPKGWQWQIGTIAVFLVWIDFMLFFDKFPWIGIYVLMFVKVVSTFVETLLVSSLLVVGFALTLYMIFHEPSIEVHEHNIMKMGSLELYFMYIAFSIFYCWSCQWLRKRGGRGGYSPP